ncbi:hypothetical protein N7510_002959 [Penicillium lagena]|uniref:uncharacterized protein n=1 Tax=Penicillium lagena TaxID=94218 RepID=UPI00253FA3DB|nr:uncharacterized protein N7510_002959 [Penicillium lagena]KAJ5618975.1 hypothetical protein N7510_002959 [Penicillium lagena]
MSNSELVLSSRAVKIKRQAHRSRAIIATFRPQTSPARPTLPAPTHSLAIYRPVRFGRARPFQQIEPSFAIDHFRRRWAISRPLPA